MESFSMGPVAIPTDDITPCDLAPATVLLVTGDDDLRAVATRILTREGYRVVAAAHSGHALLAGLRNAPIDILATEMAMDEMSGPSLAERLRRLHPDLRTVYFANAGTPECEGVLVRPFTRDDLLGRLQEAFPAEMAGTPSISAS
jgi:CheY-like chemotaxis protein